MYSWSFRLALANDLLSSSLSPGSKDNVMANDTQSSSLSPQSWFTGKVAIVTGATAALTGAIVPALLDAGATVVVTYRRESDLAKLRERAGVAPDSKLSGVTLDLTDEQAVTRAY